MAVADADTESLPHYDVEITPISSVNYEELKKATVNALNQFQIECKTKLPDEFTNYLNALMGEIESTHKAHEMHVVKASATTSNDTSEKLKNVTDVTHSGKRSLANAGQTCYMNSALQLIYSMDAIKDAVLNEKSDDALKAYLSEMEKGVTNATQLATNLYNSVNGFENRKFNQQEDSSEFLQKLIGSQTTLFESIRFDTIDSVHTTTETGTNRDQCKNKTNVISHQSYKKMPNDIQNAIIYIPGTPQPRYIYTLPISNTDILFNQIDLRNVTKIPTSYETEFLQKDGCKSIDRNTISTQSVIIPGSQQQYFIVSLNRFDSNNQKLKNQIDLTNAEITFDNSTKFKIKGCICHHGDGPQNGHYTYVEFENGNPKTVYDDADICPYNTYINIESFKDRTVDVTGYVLLFEKEK
jgi:hypothetical protein